MEALSFLSARRDRIVLPGRCGRPALAAVACLTLCATPVAAQETAVAQRSGRPDAGELAVVGVVNVALSTGVALLAARLEHRPWSAALVKEAAAGGAIHFAGEALAGVPGTSTGLFGRYVADIGASVSANALTGRTAFACLSLPAGPLWINFPGCARPRVTVDALTLIGIVFAAPGSDLLIGESLSSGVPVFARDHWNARATLSGWTLGGTVLVRATSGAGSEQERIRHERIHVIQNDMMQIAWSRPAEDWLRKRAGARLPKVFRYVDVDLYAGVGSLLDLTPLNVGAAFEREALTLDGW